MGDQRSTAIISKYRITSERVRLFKSEINSLAVLLSRWVSWRYVCRHKDKNGHYVYWLAHRGKRFFKTRIPQTLADDLITEMGG
jgi:hypothetical protein